MFALFKLFLWKINLNVLVLYIFFAKITLNTNELVGLVIFAAAACLRPICESPSTSHSKEN